jgi:membrane-associated phospholipid phosphatase
MNNSMHLFSNLGHVVILAPLSLILIFYLISIGARRDAIAFAAALIVCLTITVFAKLFFEACGARNAFSAIESPGGHASFSAVIYGVLSLLVAAGRPTAQRVALISGAALLILLIGFSRVASGAHTPQEVAAGLLIGGLSIALYRALRAEPRRLAPPWRRIALAAPLVPGARLPRPCACASLDAGAPDRRDRTPPRRPFRLLPGRLTIGAPRSSLKTPSKARRSGASS